MKTLGRKSFASALNASLGLARWVLLVLLGFMVLLVLPAYFIDSVVDLGWVSPPPPAAVLWPGLGLLIVSLLVALVVVTRLRRIFATLIAGDPFVPQNADHLQIIWMALAAYELLRLVVSSGSALSLSLTHAGQQTAGAGLRFALHINGGLWLAVAVLIVLAEVFREGASLRAEQKLTI